LLYSLLKKLKAHFRTGKMHQLLSLTILALSIHGVVLKYNCVRITNGNDCAVLAKVWDITLTGNRYDRAGNVTIDGKGGYHAFSTTTGLFSAIQLNRTGVMSSLIRFHRIFDQDTTGCESKPVAVAKTRGVCHNEPCCKTALTVTYGDGVWKITGRTADFLNTPHLVWTCTQEIPVGTGVDGSDKGLYEGWFSTAKSWISWGAKTAINNGWL